MLFFILIKTIIEYPINKQYRSRMWRLVLACIICLCPTERTLVLYGLNAFVVYVTHISCIVSSSNWIMIGYRAGFNHMNRHGVRHMWGRKSYD